MPYCHEWDEAKTLPKELFEKASAAGWLPVCVGNWPTVCKHVLRNVVSRSSRRACWRAVLRRRAARGAEKDGLLS